MSGYECTERKDRERQRSRLGSSYLKTNQMYVIGFLSKATLSESETARANNGGVEKNVRSQDFLEIQSPAM